MPNRPAKPDEMLGVGLLKKFYQILSVVESIDGGTTVRELRRLTGCSQATLYRIIRSGMEAGMLRYDELTRTYALGFRFIQLAQAASKAGDISALTVTELRRLRDLTGESVHLCSFDGTRADLRAWVDSLHTQAESDKHPNNNLLVGAAFKTCLAFKRPLMAFGKIKGEFSRMGLPMKYFDADAFNHELFEIKDRGFSVETDENFPNKQIVSAPILTRELLPLGSLSLSGPIHRMPPSRVEQLGYDIRQFAEDISRLIESSGQSRSNAPGVASAHPGQNKPAFFGRNPQWSEDQQRLFWCDSLAPEIIVFGKEPISIAPDWKQQISVTMLLADRRIAAFTKDKILVFDKSLRMTTYPAGELSMLTGLSVNKFGLPYGAIFDAVSGTTNIGHLSVEGQMQPLWNVKGSIRSLKWHPNGEILFGSDPARGVIHSFETGRSSGRIFSKLPKAAGQPYGMAVDTNGGLWAAMYDGWSIVRLDRFGEIDRTIPLPVPRPTGLAFGGPGGTRLYITTAMFELPRHVLEKAPLSGYLLEVDAGISGGLQGVAKFIPGAKKQKK